MEYRDSIKETIKRIKETNLFDDKQIEILNNTMEDIYWDKYKNNFEKLPDTIADIWMTMNKENICYDKVKKGVEDFLKDDIACKKIFEKVIVVFKNEYGIDLEKTRDI